MKVRAWDTDADKIVGYLTRRDGDSPSDWIHVMIDSYHDRRTAYEFAVNPAGVKADAYWFSDWNRDSSWDAVWDVSVSRDRARVVGRVPHPVLAAALHARSVAVVRLRHLAPDRTAERNRNVAARSRAA